MAEDTQVPARQERVLAKAGFTFMPQTWEQLFSYAKEIAQTDFVPDSMRGKPGAVLAAWQKGQEVGLPPMAALESIAIINGRPAIHSEGYWSLIVGHPLCEWTKELGPDEALKAGYGECTIQRRGSPHPVTRRFTIEMAEKAGLWGGTGDTKEKKEKSVWFKYPGRMLQQRARHIAGDDALPEATQGLIPADVARDLEPRDVTPKEEIPFKKPEAISDSSTEEATKADARSEVAEGGTKKAGAEKLTKQIALEWVANAPETEILDNNELAKYIKGLKQAEQLEVCQKYNARRQAILAELEKGSNADADAG